MLKRLSLVFVLALGACAPPWLILRQGPPNVLTPNAQLAIDNTTFNQLLVGRKPEPQYLASKSPEQQAGWQNDKMAFLAGFMTAVQQLRGPLDIGGPEQLAGRFSIRSNVVFLEPGNFNGFFNIATEMRTRVLISDPNQQPIDEIEVRCWVPADLYRPSVGIRVSECGRQTGVRVARYLRRRTGVE